MKKWLAALFLVALFVTGCTDRKTGKITEVLSNDSTEMVDTIAAESDDPDELIAEEPMSAAVDELFDDFIFNFIANRRLQLERIVFPLPVVSDDKEEHIEKSKWKMEHIRLLSFYP